MWPDFYRQHELRVAILSRGYGSNRGRNDEALVLKETCPMCRTFKERIESLLAAGRSRIGRARFSSSTMAFSIAGWHRDLDMVLIDATEPWGHGYLVPRGLLREPAASLRRGRGGVADAL